MFLKLAPETVRLRRLARAFAAGEMSEAEYRQARRQIIDEFLAAAPAAGVAPAAAPSQNTTRRRSSDIAVVPESPPERETPAALPAALPALRRNWRWLVAAVVLLAVVGVLV
jgi:hypothetical protein